MAAGHSLDPGRAESVFRELMGAVAGRFGRIEPRRTAERMVRGLLAELERHRIGYVLATSRSMRAGIGPARVRVDELAAQLPEYCWQTRTAGAGAKGPRWYQWAFLHLDGPEPPAEGRRYLLIRRNPATGETAFYRCWSPVAVGLNTLIRTAGMRWKVEEAFQTGKGLAGLDEHQVRRYIS